MIILRFMFIAFNPYLIIYTGHLAYTLAVRLSTIVNPLACFLVLFLQPISIQGLSLLIAIATSLSAYLLYLAALSPNPPLHDHVLGVTLVVSFDLKLFLYLYTVLSIYCYLPYFSLVFLSVFIIMYVTENIDTRNCNYMYFKMQ